MDGLCIRPATNDDRAAVRDLVQAILAEYGQPLSLETSDADLVDIEKSYDATGGNLLLAFDADARLVGTVGLVGGPEGEAKLRKMYVAPTARGQGLGRRLLEELLTMARSRGVRSIYLETMNTMHAAMSLYESAGFRRVEQETFESPRCHYAYRLEL